MLVAKAPADAKAPEYADAVKIPCWKKVLCVVGVFLCLWLFLCGLGLMGSSFKVLGGKSAGNLFGWITDPIVGLMVGILATVLVQSSSTSTSIVVGLVGSDIMTVQTAIPIIMGANIGTSVTSTLVSLGQLNNKQEFERAFAGATVHDMFNYLAVAVILPLEIITNAFNGGDGGVLFLISEGMTKSMQGGGTGGTFDSPVKILTNDIVEGLILVDKDKIKALSMGMPTLKTCLGSLADVKKVAKVSYTICGNQTLLADSLVVWQENIVDGQLVKGGAFLGQPDALSGSVCLVLSLVMLCTALYGIVKLLKLLVLSGNQKLWAKVLNMNGYLAIIVGAGLTIAVQSSSIITSTLVPLVGLGTLTLEGMLPLTLGSNIGTTCTALLAALASGKVAALQIALCHLMFNILGILIFYPIPPMRRLPISAARKLGYLTICFKPFPFVYILTAFFIVPLSILALGQMMNAGAGGLVVGTIICAFIAVGGIAMIYMYRYKGYRAKVLLFLDKKYKERAVQVAKPAKACASAHEKTPEEATTEESPSGSVSVHINEAASPGSVSVHLNEEGPAAAPASESSADTLL